MTTPSDRSSEMGYQRLGDPVLNKGTAFSAEERQRYGLEGLLPVSVETLDQQLQRVLGHLDAKDNDLERYIYLIGLADRNETLFYKTLMSDPVRFVPIVYDPTVADACLNFDHIFRRSRGMYLTRDMKDRFAEVLRNWPQKDVRFICVSSGGRILGLGDIGANGMGIPIGKLQLYTACAAVPPQQLLPILLDIGTTNEKLRNDPMYLGLRQEPPTPDEVDAIADAFVAAANEVFHHARAERPRPEDWKGTDAMRLLARYREKILCYNDDIQGTSAITVAGLTTALQIKKEKMSEQRVLFLGAGSAGLGIAGMIASAMQMDGLSKEQALEQIRLVDVNGLIESSRTDLNEWQKPFAHADHPSKDLLDVVKTFKPTILIGVSTTAGAFTEAVVKEMAALNQQPIIFALSNPTDHAECSAEQAYQWTDGRVLFAAGVQFDDVTYKGKTYHPGQANNFLIFPATSLAVYATRPQRITDALFIETARAVANQVTDAQRAQGMLYPPTENVLDMEVTAAVHVAEYIFDQGMATVERPANIRQWIEGMLYRPEY